MMQDVITQVSPNAPIAMGMSDPELEQEIFAVEQRLIQQGGTGVPLDEHGPVSYTHLTLPTKRIE